MKHPITCLAVAIGLMLTGCGETETSAPQTAPSSSHNDGANWQLADAPADAIDVALAKGIAAQGDKVTIRGKIGGRMEPISLESGVFVLMDPAIPSCADMENDGCSTPWDYCCESPETIMTNAATVQLRNASGDPLRLEDGDLSPLDTVIVVGEVGPRANEQVMVILATGVYKVPG